MFSCSLQRLWYPGLSGAAGTNGVGFLLWRLPALTRPTVCLSGATTSDPPISEYTRYVHEQCYRTDVHVHVHCMCTVDVCHSALCIQSSV